jgi:hypothetical protein
MISHLFREAVEAGKAEDIEPEYFQGLTQLAVSVLGECILAPHTDIKSLGSSKHSQPKL